MIEVRDFSPEHLNEIKNRKQVFSSEDGLDDRFVSIYHSPGSIMFSLFHNSKCIGVLGGAFVWGGVMHVFTLLSEDVRECPIEFHKKVKDIIDKSFEHLNLHRMQMEVRVGYFEGSRWAKSLGFSVEGVMKMYGVDQQDYYLFGRTC